ncbi:hypothetical protein OIU79_001882 [Salix purpurea]|uniref:Uncharacterized protein n=1 Tax=Salix purpurea TaxID=77065 RepID=A0A9Q0ZHK1_SALPP|nr:hypothetical protein OIU79_001882 [Salix purpurea]
MGRPPCCDKIGVKKGPWTPEEDIILVSYIQEHGPGNWRAVPTNTASYLPQRTDNDIKNFWNTHLKKKLRKIQAGQGDQSRDGLSSAGSQQISRGQWERRLQTDINMARQALCEALSPARLLKGWMINGPKQSLKNSTTTQNSFINMAGADLLSGEGTPDKADKNGTGLSQTFESLFGFDSFDSSNSDFSQPMSPDTGLFQDESKPNSGGQVPLSLIERWLFDEGAMQGKDYLNEVTIDEDNLF